jgi:DNA-binding PucR family transcriptional regulator
MEVLLLRWVDREPTAADVASVLDALRGWAESRVIRLGTRRHLLLVSGAELDEVARVVRARRPDVHICPYSLARFLDPRDASLFVHDQLAALADHDREHGTDLLRVLELALDHHDRNDAARAAFMHRNTFRRRLRQAEQLAGADLACPEERLALHLALKLRALSRAS